MTTTKPLSVQEFCLVASQFATGIAIVTGNEKGKLVGFSAQSFVSLSIDPVLVLFCPQKTSTSWPRVRALGNYGINVLGANQSSTSDAFAKVGQVPQVSWMPSVKTGVPQLTDCIAFLDCSLEIEHVAGDHTMVVSSVNDAIITRPDESPLVYFRSKYGTFTPNQ